uniref:hypothetical protein n=1 Tax=Escherichia coli TaxID=562 RepID=UPI003D4F42BF
MIKDCFGIGARVGDHIAFSRGNAGAKPFEMAVITKMTEKSVFFSGKTGSMYRSNSDELRRGEGCFAIDVSKREAEALKELVGLSEQDKKEGRVYSRDQLMETLDA